MTSQQPRQPQAALEAMVAPAGSHHLLQGFLGSHHLHVFMIRAISFAEVLPEPSPCCHRISSCCPSVRLRKTQDALKSTPYCSSHCWLNALLSRGCCEAAAIKMENASMQRHCRNGLILKTILKINKQIHQNKGFSKSCDTKLNWLLFLYFY